MEGEASRRKINTDIARKNRQFADPEHGYTAKDLEELCRLCDEHDCVFGVTSVYKLLTIKDRNERSEIQETAIRNRWTLAELEVELRRRFGSRGSGGRRPKMPATKGETLVQLESMSLTWIRWCDGLGVKAIAPNDEEKKDKPPAPLRNLPNEIQEQLASMRTMFEQLRADVDKALGPRKKQQNKKSRGRRAKG